MKKKIICKYFCKIRRITIAVNGGLMHIYIFYLNKKEKYYTNPMLLLNSSIIRELLR